MSTRGRLVGLSLCVAVHGILLWIYWIPEPKQLLGDEAMYWQVALRAAQGGAVELPLLWPPLQAHLLAWLVRTFGESLLAVQIVQTALLVAAALLARDAWLRLTGLRAAADLLGLWMLAYPPLVAFAHHLWPEVLHLALASGAVWILVARRESVLWAVGAGFYTKFPNLARCIDAQDWLGCVASCKIREEGNPGVVPRNAKNRLCFTNAAHVVAAGLDVNETFWPVTVLEPVTITP